MGRSEAMSTCWRISEDPGWWWWLLLLLLLLLLFLHSAIVDPLGTTAPTILLIVRPCRLRERDSACERP
jgi:hypothetical protein